MIKNFDPLLVHTLFFFIYRFSIFCVRDFFAMAMLLFAASAPLPVSRCASNASCAVRPRTCTAMEFKGFGEQKAKPSPSKAQKRREAAASRYDAMAASGMPEYSVWLRLKEPPRPEGVSKDDPDFQEMPWLPVGSLAVPRSSQVSQAIFDAEEDLLQGAYRLYPNLKNEEKENIEYGFQLKQFPDEEIRKAERKQTGGFMGSFQEWIDKLTSPMNASS